MCFIFFTHLLFHCWPSCLEEMASSICLKMCSIIPICVIHLASYDRGEILPASKCFRQNIFAIRHHAVVKQE